MEQTAVLQRHVVIAALLGFVLIGSGAVGCVCFGIVEITSKDSVFLNDGLGEVLTVLGIYFTVPYLFCVGAFILIVLRPFDKDSDDDSAMNDRKGAALETNVIFGLTILCFVVQQVFTNIYLDILVDRWVLFVVILDLWVLGTHLYYKFEKPYASLLYTIVYAIKMAVQWNDAYLTANQAFFGPNGVSVMLFLCIPLIQFPLYVMGTSATRIEVTQRSDNAIEGRAASEGIVTSFTNNFNLFLSHLLNSLDIISMYSFAFVPPESNINQVAAPKQLKVFVMILIFVAFVGNNVSVLHLFYRRDRVEEAEIVFLPKKFRQVTKAVDADDESGSQRRRIFQYLLFMLVVCDVPMLLTRLELWRQQYSTLNIFVAKNIKSIADAVILVLRADDNSDKQKNQKQNAQRYSLAGLAQSPSTGNAVDVSSARFMR
jgi:hypothetical protein